MDGFPFRFNAGGGTNVNTTKLYETLGINKSASEKDIKKAYRRLAMQYHPDKGGDEQKFKEINAAYQILSDPKKRSNYDQFGLEGVSDESGGSVGVPDIFDLFGFRSTFSKSVSRKKGESVMYKINLTLEELYVGKTVKYKIGRNVVVGDATSCTSCKGSGFMTDKQQVGPGSTQIIQRQCGTCRGSGVRVHMAQESEVVEVQIERGMKHGEKIVMQGYGNEYPGADAGDVIFEINQISHRIFTRKQDDLVITQHLTLNEALCGFQHLIAHLDKRGVLIKSRPGEILKSVNSDGSRFVKVVHGEGMPIRGQGFLDKGDLFIFFIVEFPRDNELSKETMYKLGQILPNIPTDMDEDVDMVEEVEMMPADVNDIGKATAFTRDDRDEEEEGVERCRQA